MTRSAGAVSFIAKLSSWLLATTSVGLIASCDAHSSEAAQARGDIDASAGAVDGEPEADEAVREPPEAPFTARTMTLETASCSPQRANLVVASARRVLVTTGCGFYAVDPVAEQVEQLAAQGDDIDSDGQTVAVLAGKLGLSIDGGETFAWTEWSLSRCQGTPRVSAGAGLAVVTCVAGVGRWRGQGTAFELLSPEGMLPIAAKVAAGGTHVIINELADWFVSADGGDSFVPLAVEGLPTGGSPQDMKIIDSELWVAIGTAGAELSESSSTLYVAALSSGAFEARDAFPGAPGVLSLSHNDGALVVNGTRTFLSKDRGAHFMELALRSVNGLPRPARYASGYLYRVANGTLYVDAVAP
jgi:hypothetical protein